MHVYPVILLCYVVYMVVRFKALLIKNKLHDFYNKAEGRVFFCSKANYICKRS